MVLIFVLIFNNEDKIMKKISSSAIPILQHKWYQSFFFYNLFKIGKLVWLYCLVSCIREINKIVNRDEKKCDLIFLPYCPTHSKE